MLDKYGLREAIFLAKSGDKNTVQDVCNRELRGGFIILKSIAKMSIARGPNFC